MKTVIQTLVIIFCIYSCDTWEYDETQAPIKIENVTSDFIVTFSNDTIEARSGQQVIGCQTITIKNQGNKTHGFRFKFVTDNPVTYATTGNGGSYYCSSNTGDSAVTEWWSKTRWFNPGEVRRFYPSFRVAQNTNVRIDSIIGYNGIIDVPLNEGYVKVK